MGFRLYLINLDNEKETSLGLFQIHPEKGDGRELTRRQNFNQAMIMETEGLLGGFRGFGSEEGEVQI